MSELSAVQKSIWIDAHCHLSEGMATDAMHENLNSLISKGCCGLVFGGIDGEDWHRQLRITSDRIPIFRSFGLHPWVIQGSEPEHLQRLWLDLIKMMPAADAMGEMGLDYSQAKSAAARSLQQFWFERQLELVQNSPIPRILHIVKAHHQALPTVKRFGLTQTGIVHGFWEGPTVARGWLDLGYILSLPPRIQKSDPHRLLSYLPRDRVVFESDQHLFDPSGSAQGACVVPLSLHLAAKTWGEDLSITQKRHNDVILRLFNKNACLPAV